MEKKERLSIIFESLIAAPRPSNFDEAWKLLHNTFNEIEDRLSGVPFNPSDWKNDGRLYPPEFDSELQCALKGVRMFRARRHRIYIAANGAILIGSVIDPRDIPMDIPGKDGKRCPR
jgi:hypothetical protein